MILKVCVWQVGSPLQCGCLIASIALLPWQLQQNILYPAMVANLQQKQFILLIIILTSKVQTENQLNTPSFKLVELFVYLFGCYGNYLL